MLEIIKKDELIFWHIDSQKGAFTLGKYSFSIDDDFFQVIEEGHAKRKQYHLSEIIVYDDTNGSVPETFINSIAFVSRLRDLGYRGFDLNNVAISITHNKGFWNATTNTPLLSNATGKKGDYYTVVGNGVFQGTEYKSGDRIEHDGQQWFKAVNNNQNNINMDIKRWFYHIPLTAHPSNLFFANVTSGGSYPVSSDLVGSNYFQLMSDSPYGTGLNINSFESGVNLFDGESLLAEIVYDTSVNDLPEYYNDTCWRVAIGQTGIETDFTGLDFCLNGMIQIASKRNTDITRIDTAILFSKDVIYSVQITRSAQGYSINITDKKNKQTLFETVITTNVSELGGFTVFPYNRTGSAPSGLFKMGVIKLGYCPK